MSLVPDQVPIKLRKEKLPNDLRNHLTSNQVHNVHLLFDSIFCHLLEVLLLPITEVKEPAT